VPFLTAFYSMFECWNFQEKEKKFMLPLDGLKVKDVESGLFTKHCFALFNPDSGRYVMKTEQLCCVFIHISSSQYSDLPRYVSNKKSLGCCVYIICHPACAWLGVWWCSTLISLDLNSYDDTYISTVISSRLPMGYINTIFSLKGA
jgi:hypothetical protein